MENTDFQHRIECQFDSYCKTVLRNALRSILRHRRYRAKYEIPYDSLLIGTINERKHYDQYFQNDVTFHLTADVDILLQKSLADAIRALSEEQRLILMPYYFLGESDYDIAKELHMVRRTVSRRRNAALLFLQRILKDGE